jgi:hypothetical protein
MPILHKIFAWSSAVTRPRVIAWLTAFCLLILPLTASSQGAAPNGGFQVDAVGVTFTYQGQLAANGVVANGQYDFRFTLYGVESGGTELVPSVIVTNVTVSVGAFTVQLNFGNVFMGEPRWLEIAVRQATAILSPSPRASPCSPRPMPSMPTQRGRSLGPISRGFRLIWVSTRSRVMGCY